MSEANAAGGESVAPWVVRLRYVVKDLGAPAVCESLGVTPEGLDSLVLGEAELEPEMEEMLDKLCQAFGEAIGAVDDLEDVIALSRGQTESDLDHEDAIQGPVSGVEGHLAGVSPGDGGMDASPLASGDGAGTGPGAELPADGVSAAGILGEGTGGSGVIMPGKRWSEDIEMRRRALWTARGVAVMSQFRLDLEYHEHVASLACVAQVELALISFFMESVPDPGEVWNPAKRAREIERRLRRIRWSEAEQRREFGGFRGAWNWLVGRKRVSGKELYQRMVAEADEMMGAIADLDRGERVLDEVMRFTGMEVQGPGSRG